MPGREAGKEKPGSAQALPGLKPTFQTGTIYIYNPGTEPLDISDIEIMGAISFVFTPGAQGFRAAALTISNDSPTNPQSIPMTGYGYRGDGNTLEIIQGEFW